jgi:putative transposase
MPKYQNKYRIETARASWWDYGWNGAYFITICTRDRRHYFGKIQNNQLVYSPVAAIADLLWQEIPHRHPYVKLGEFVLMPNHLHGILIINRPPNVSNTAPDDNPLASHIPWLDMDRLQAPADLGIQMLKNGDVKNGDVETGHALSRRFNPGQKRFRNPGKHTLSTIVGGYKSAVSKHARRMGLEFGWQLRFHDRIVRDQGELDRITRYIRNNPKNWRYDWFSG